jgi:cysteine synthase
MTPRKVNSVLELVGNTPLVRINRLNPAPGVEVLVKLEGLNPGGSVKDRIALKMIQQAEAGGELTPGKIVLEASSGNTAIGLAMVCAVKGYQLLVTMSESASEERKRILKAYGAQILLTPGYRGTDGAIEEAYRLAREEPGKYVLVDQFNNEANWQAHYEGTGKEIWEATAGKVDVVVVAMGTTGTLMGTTRALRELNPAVRVIGVEPFKDHKIQGLKKASRRCASNSHTTIPRPASTSATWSNRPAAFWKWAWPTRNCDRSTSASAVFPTTEDCRASRRSGCGARSPRPTTTMTRTIPATSPCSSAPRWRS